MCDEGVQKGWHEAVRAFRNAVNVLIQPAPGAFVDMMLVKRFLTTLSPDLPLVDFSPFNVLPDDPADGRRGHAPITDSANTRAPDHTPEQVINPAIPVKPRVSLPSGQRSSLQGTVPLESVKSVTLPPVFSFQRRGERATHGHEPGDLAPQKGFTQNRVAKEGASSMPVEEPSHGQTVKNNQRDPAHGTEFSAPTSGHKAQRGIKAPLHHEAGTHPQSIDKLLHTMSVIGSLADNVLQQADSPVSGKTPEMQPTVSKVTRGDHLPQINSPTGELTEPKMSESPHKDQLIQRASKTSPSRENNHMISHGQKQSARSADAHREIFGGSAFTLIDSLAESLLSSPGASATEIRKSQKSASHRTEAPNQMPVPDNYRKSPPLVCSAAASLPSTDIEQTPAGPWSMVLSQLDELNKIPSGPGQQMDADTLASLINDVLVSQARRHGVDLS